MFIYSLITTVPSPRRVDIGRLMIHAIENAHRSQKEAYLAMGLDASQWSRAIAGQKGYSLDLWKMLEIPWWFWSEFLPLLASAVMRVWIADLRHDLSAHGHDGKDVPS